LSAFKAFKVFFIRLTVPFLRTLWEPDWSRDRWVLDCRPREEPLDVDWGGATFSGIAYKYAFNSVSGSSINVKFKYYGLILSFTAIVASASFTI
jgi:hypothetical protein